MVRISDAQWYINKLTKFVNKNVDISKYPKLRAVLKRRNDRYSSRKSCVFTSEGINLFFEDAANKMFILTYDGMVHTSFSGNLF